MPHSKGWRRRDRRAPGEAPIGAILDELLQEPVFARGAPIGRLAVAWADVVGPRLAAETAPVSLEQGVLVVAATSGPWGAQARFLAGEIQRRANACLGEEVVRRVQVVVRPDRPGSPEPL